MSRRTVPDGTPPPTDPPPQPKPPTGPGRIVDDEYLTVAEVAGVLHLSPKSVYRRIYDGDLPYSNVAPSGARRASIRVRRSAAHQYMTKRERTGCAR